ncbi:hypothetical protein SUGI_0888740 [Cryptomeria japonica]|nr:hypothetical protein SUGI_0888740 [Cryptomeria japonica]
MAQTLRGLSPPLCRAGFNGEIKYCRSVASLMRARPGVSLASSSRQLLQGAQFLNFRASGLRVWKHTSFSAVRCEQSTDKGNDLSVWLGRIAMLSFAAAITVEITTGKGLLQNIGLTSPLPTVSLGLTAAIGILTAYFIFDSGSKD